MNKAYITILILLVSLVGCTSVISTGSDSQPTVGSDRDANGCIGSAGYRWCARTEACERPWEIAEKAGFSNTPDEVEKYCGG